MNANVELVEAIDEDFEEFLAMVYALKELEIENAMCEEAFRLGNASLRASIMHFLDINGEEYTVSGDTLRIALPA